VQFLSNQVTGELPLDDLKLRYLGSQRTKEYLLTDVHLWVAGLWAHVSGEIFDARNVVLRAQDALAHLFEVDPLVRSAPEGGVVEIEAINIDRCSSHSALSKKARASEE